MQKPEIVVLGKNYSTALGVIRALGREGYPITLVYVTGKKGGSHIASASRYVRRTVEQLGRKDGELVERLVELAGENDGQKVLFPTDDYTASLIDQHRDALAAHYVMPYLEGGGQGSVTRQMDKMVQIARAEEYGLRTAATWEIDLRPDEIVIPDDVVFPCFCKPAVSARGLKREIGMCETREALTEKLYRLQRAMRGRTVLVQEMLTIEEEYSISGVCLGETVVLPALLKKLCIAEHEKGVTLLGQVCRFDSLEYVREQLTGMLSTLGYHGMIDIELIDCGGTIYFNEMNFRNSGVSYGVTQAGVNLPAMLVRHLTGEASGAEPSELRYGLRFLYDKAAYEDVLFGDISQTAFEEYQRMADFTMLRDEEDPEPERHFLQEMRRKAVKERIKRLAVVRLIRKITGR